VTLHLEAGAALLASRDRKDYIDVAKGPKDGLGCSQLLYGEDLEDIAITGRGAIDGSGPSFWTTRMINAVVLKPKKWRPRSMILLKNCRNVSIRDVTLRNSPTFTLWLLGCQSAVIHGVNILNPRNGPNTDAIDLDCSSHVRISDCHIVAGDDCIAIKSDFELLGRNAPCQNITVTNCTFSSSACAIRVGYEGDAPIRNCVFSNLVITDSDIAIDVVSILPAKGVFDRIKKGVRIERLLFSNIIIDNVNRALFVWMGQDRPGKFSGHIRDLRFHQIIARSRQGCFIGSLADRPIESVSLSQVKLSLIGARTGPESPLPIVWGGGGTAHAIHAHHVDGLELTDTEIDWKEARGPWQGDLLQSRLKGLCVHNFRGHGAQLDTNS